MTDQQIARKYELERLPKNTLLVLLSDKRRESGIVTYGPPVSKLSRGEMAREIAELEAGR